jgi:hypothetical protein
MIKDVVIQQSGLLRIASGTFVCMVGHSEKAQMSDLQEALSEWP